MGITMCNNVSDFGKASRQEARKNVKPRNAKNFIAFSTSFNPHRPDYQKIMN